MDPDSTRMFEAVARYFTVLAAPTRLRILHVLCDQERSVGDIVARVGTQAANVSQQLRVMYEAGVLGRRREGHQVFYRVADGKAVEICRFVSVMVAGGPKEVP